MPASRPPPGFSLIEVVIAVGVLGFSIGSVLALLPALTRQMSQAADALGAHRLPAAIEAELVRAAKGGSLTGLASQIKPMGSSATLRMVASRDGGEVHLADDPALAPDRQYFLVELRPFPAAPLAFGGAGGAFLAAYARIAWPYRRPNPTGGPAVETAAADRAEFAFPVAINR